MPSRSPRTPSYRLHKPSGQAVVTLDGRDFYLGLHGTDVSKQAYDRIVAEWLTSGRRAPLRSAITIVELVSRFRESLVGRYRSNEIENIRLAIRPVRQLYGHTSAEAFGPLALKAVRARFVEAGLARRTINRRVRSIVRMFKFGVGEELIPSSTWEALRAVEGLRKGEAGLKEGKKIRAVPDAFVDPVLPHIPRQVAAMIQLQRLTGARSGEIVIIRGCDLTTSGKVWEYRPEFHKTEHHGHERTIYIGPFAQEVLKPFLRAEPTEYLFQPREATAERYKAMRAARESKVQPSQVDRSKAAPKKTPGERYTPGSYRQAISRGVAKANAARKKIDPEAAEIPNWHPHQLRHTAATKLRREFDLDAARAVLGHTSPAVTEVYAELDAAKAREAMERIG